MSDGASPIDISTIHKKLSLVLERIGVEDRRFLTIGNAAIYSDLSEKSIRRLIAQGTLTALRPVRGRVLIDRRQLDAVVLAADGRPRNGRGLPVRRSSEPSTTQ